MPRHLFICGCPRSGTTILTNLLNRHPDICLGIERYIGLVQLGFPLTPDLFAPERFLDIRPGDTFYTDFSVFAEYAGIAQRYGSASLIGDKVPTYYLKYDELLDNFPQSRIVFIVRNIYDVALSYRQRAENPDDHLWPADKSALAAIPEWNAALERTLAARARGRILVVSFEDLLLGQAGFEALSEFLGLDLSGIRPDFVTANRQYEGSRLRTKALSSLENFRIAREADFASYRTLLAGAESPETAPVKRGFFRRFGAKRRTVR